MDREHNHVAGSPTFERASTQPAGSPSGPRVSVLIVSWNTRESTLACLASLPLGMGTVPYEVVVVDNGSVDGTPDALRAYEGISLIENKANAGFAVGVNQAYARARGEFVLLLNSDVVVEPGAIERLVRFLDDRGDVAGTAPLYLNPDGSPQRFHFRLLSFPMAVANVSRLFDGLLASQVRRYRMLDDDLSFPQPVEQPSASCLLLRRSRIPGDRLLDERFPIYFNDVDLARRLSRAGEELWLVPDAQVVHEHGASGRQLGRAGRRQYLGALVRYLELTCPPGRVRAFRLLILAQGIVLRFLRRPDALPIKELWHAARGDPGRLPRAPLRA
jgi:GT2 family glycosyltransferase